MVKMRNLVKVGNREVKKRYIGNKLIFEDLGDKTEILSGTEIYTDKADDSVVHVEIDGKSYQGGVPTPENPIEIHSVNDFDVVSQKPEGGMIDGVEVGGRNYYVVANMEPRPSAIDRWRHYTFKVEPNQLHTLSIHGAHTGRTFTVDEIEVWFNEARDGYQFSSNSDGIVTVAFWDYEDLPFIDGTAKIKLEKGNKATDWTPAPEDISESDNHPLIDKINLLLSEPLRSVYDVKDRLFRDSDGLWKIERNLGEEVFENGDKWNNDYLFGRETSAVYGISYANASYMKERGIISLSHVPDDRIGAGADENEGWLQTNPRLRIRLQHSVIGTTQPSVSAFKDWLKNEHGNGTPLTVVYELAEPTIETLDQELQDKLNNLRSFQGSDYIYTVLNETDILPTVAENLKPTLHAAFKSKGWYDYYLKTLLK